MVPFSQTRGYAPKHEAVLAAIIEYLEDAYPNPPLFHGRLRRARCRLLELEANEVPLTQVCALMHRTEPPGPDASRRQLQEQEAAKAEDAILRHYDNISARLSGSEFLCGDFSVADLATFMVVHYAQRLGGPPVSVP